MKITLERCGAIAGLAGFLVGCSGVETVPPADGTDEYVFACTKDAGQPSCEARARVVCPDGYETLSSEEDFDRKELRVRCSAEEGSDI
jgi:hypothetical protein